MTVDPTSEGLFVRRRLDAAPERVFDAWIDPDLARRWLLTAQVGSIAAVAIDARPGGLVRLEGSLHRGFGEIVEMDRPRRLVLAFGIPALGPSLDRIVAEFEPDGSGCLLSVTKEGLPPELADETVQDWERMLDRLAAALG